MYNSQHGVTNYIDEMNATYYTGRANVRDWDYKLRRLKDVRHKRNKLSHGEVSFNTPWAEAADIQFINDFKSSIFRGDDPLATSHKQSFKWLQYQQPVQYGNYTSNTPQEPNNYENNISHSQNYTQPQYQQYMQYQRYTNANKKRLKSRNIDGCLIAICFCLIIVSILIIFCFIS